MNIPCVSVAELFSLRSVRHFGARNKIAAQMASKTDIEAALAPLRQAVHEQVRDTWH